MQMAIAHAREANPAIKIGVCGEHGGDPESIEFLQTLDLNYLSCSAARIPAARLAIAQAAISGDANHSQLTSTLLSMEVPREALGVAI
jgi:pyruvate,orthophosphate dikinase